MGRLTKTQTQNKVRAEKAQANILAEIDRLMTKHATKLVVCERFRIDVTMRDDGTAGVNLSYNTVVNEAGSIALDDQSDLQLQEPPQ